MFLVIRASHGVGILLDTMSILLLLLLLVLPSFRIEGYMDEKKQNFRGQFAKQGQPHQQTNDRCNKMTKEQVQGNFMTQNSRFASS
jgi:hypothetical protein